MKILLLDDNPYRHRQVATMFPNDEIDGYTDIWQAQEAVSTVKYDLLMLDYDLDMNDQNAITFAGNSLPLTGSDFVTFMLTQVDPSLWPSKTIIISIDKVGAAEMMFLLRNCGLEVSWEPLPN